MSSLYKLDNILAILQLRLFCRIINMIKKRLLLLLTIVTCNAFPNDVNDFDKVSSSLSKEETSSQLKLSNEKLGRTVESLPQDAETPFLSHFIHHGSNLFFKPNIVIGSKMENPLLSRDAVEKTEQELKERRKRIKKHHSKEKARTTTTATTTTATAPTTTPVPTTTAAPTTTITAATSTVATTTMKTLEKIDKFSSAESQEKEEKIPEPPFLPPLMMPKLPEPIILRESEQVVQPIIIPQPPAFVNLNLPPTDLFSRHVEYMPPYLPIHFRDPYVIQDPYAPPPASEQYQGIHERLSAEKNIIPPKLPQLVQLQPVSGVPCPPEIVGTRFVPYTSVSKMSMENINRKSSEVPCWQIPQVLVERIPLRKEKDTAINFPSLSAYCAHNIALERALPNIVPNKEKINDPYLPHWIYP